MESDLTGHQLSKELDQHTKNMGTYLNHQVTFIFREDESYWASQLPENSSGWYSDDDRLYSHDEYEETTAGIKERGINYH